MRLAFPLFPWPEAAYVGASNLRDTNTAEYSARMEHGETENGTARRAVAFIPRMVEFERTNENRG